VRNSSQACVTLIDDRYGRAVCRVRGRLCDDPVEHQQRDRLEQRAHPARFVEKPSFSPERHPLRKQPIGMTGQVEYLQRRPSLAQRSGQLVAVQIGAATVTS
jgi:hypothetical protein